MKYKKATLFLVLILLLNIVLISWGIVINNNKTNDDRRAFANSFKTNLFAKTVTRGEAQTHDEMLSMMDSYYTDDTGEVVKGIQADTKNNEFNDSGKQLRENVATSFFSEYISWDEFNYIFENSNTDITQFENTDLISLIMMADKGLSPLVVFDKFGVDTSGFLDFSTSLVAAYAADDSILTWLIVSLLLPNGLEGGIRLNFLIETLISFSDPEQYPNWVVNNLGGIVDNFLSDFQTDHGISDEDWPEALSLLISAVDAVDTVLSKIKIDLLETGSQFTYNETIDGVSREVSYDFSGKMYLDEWAGVEGESLGVKNWSNDETHQYFSSVAIRTDLRNAGDLHLSSISSFAFPLSSDSIKYLNSYYARINDKYEGKKYKLMGTVKTSPVEDETFPWAVASTKTVEIDTTGEAFLYDVYSNIDYTEFYNRALIEDGLSEYKFSYTEQLYGNQELNASDFSKDTSNYEDTIYKPGNGGVTFDEFVFISRTYRPMLRSTNFDLFIHEVSKLIVE